MAASVRSRLTMLAHAEGEEPEYVLTRYALERLLYRLGRSTHAGAFVLKGALLFALWEGHPHRATRDLDLLGFGDVVTPSAQEADLPTLLDLPAPHLRVYPRETVVAEKFEAMVRLGLTNTRMKDFYDLRAMAERFSFEGPTLMAAISATFARRGTPIPASAPLALTSEFAEDAGKQAEWQGFLKRNKMDPAESPLAATIEYLRGFLLPPLHSFAEDIRFTMRWQPGSQWQPVST